MSLDRDVALLSAFFAEPSEPNIFGSLAVPPFHSRTHGEWSLENMTHRTPVRVRGYFSPGYQEVSSNWVLYKGKTTWMSVTPMELESQAHHALAAKGRVLIGGLGMGVLAWNVARKPSVTEVVVIERDVNVIAMTSAIAAEEKWAHWDKVQIINDDMLTVNILGRMFDVALIDIWPSVGDLALREDMQRIVRNIPAKEYAGWGMEFDFLSWMAQSGLPPRPIRARYWRDYSKSIGVPLIMRHEDRMALLAYQAVIQGMKHEADKLMGRE